MKVLETLSLIGAVPELWPETGDQAVMLCEALFRGGLPAAEITLPTDEAARVISRVRRTAPDMVLGIGGVTDPAQAERAIAAGASYVVSPRPDPAVARVCAVGGVLYIPRVSGAEEAAEAETEGLEAVGVSAGVYAALMKDAAAAAGGPVFLMTGGVTAENLAACLAMPRVAAAGGQLIPSDATRDRDRAEALAGEIVDRVLGLELKHVGINSGSPEQAATDAGTMCRLLGWKVRVGNKSIFAGSGFECMKLPFRGTHGHAAIGTNDVKRAIWHLERRGFSFDGSSAGFKEGRMTAIYLNEEIAGFAFHLLQK